MTHARTPPSPPHTHPPAHTHTRAHARARTHRRYEEALDGHLELRTERLENTCNPRFRRRLEWEVATLARRSEMHKAYERELMIFIVYDDPDVFGCEGARGDSNIIGVFECSLEDIVEACEASGALTRPLRNLRHDSSGYADPNANGQIVLTATENLGADLLTLIKMNSPRGGLTEPASPASPLPADAAGVEGVQRTGSEAGSTRSHLDSRIPAYTPRIERWVVALELEFLHAFDRVTHDMQQALASCHQHSPSPPHCHSPAHLPPAHTHGGGNEGGGVERKEHGASWMVDYTIDFHTFLDLAVQCGVLAAVHGAGGAPAGPAQGELGAGRVHEGTSAACALGSAAAASKACQLGMMTKKDVLKVFDEVAGSEHAIDRQQLSQVLRSPLLSCVLPS